MDENEFKSKISLIKNYNYKESNKLSIIIASYNANDLLIKCLDSLRIQSFKDFDIILVDNGKNQRIISKLATYSLKYIKLNINYGPSTARNIGVFYSNGDILVFLDDDAIADVHFVQQYINAYKNQIIIGVRGKVIPITDIVYNLMQNHYNFGELTVDALLDMEANCSVKREAFISVNGFKDDVFGHEGIDLSFRLYKKYKSDFKIIYDPKILIYHDYANSFRKLLKKEIRHWVIMNKRVTDYDRNIIEFTKRYYYLYINKDFKNIPLSKKCQLSLIKFIIRFYLASYKRILKLRHE